MSINCWSQNQRIVIDKKNIEEQFLHFDIRLDGITYNAYLSNTNSDSIFTSPNEDHIGFIEKKNTQS